MFPMLRHIALMICIEYRMYDSIFLRDPPTKAAVTVVDLLFQDSIHLCIHNMK